MYIVIKLPDQEFRCSENEFGQLVHNMPPQLPVKWSLVIGKMYPETDRSNPAVGEIDNNDDRLPMWYVSFEVRTDGSCIRVRRGASLTNYRKGDGFERLQPPRVSQQVKELLEPLALKFNLKLEVVW